MKINLWEIASEDDIIFYNTIEDIIEAIKSGKIGINFRVTDQYHKIFYPPKTSFEKEIASNEYIQFVITDDKHPVACFTDENYMPIFNTVFFNKYKEQIIGAFHEQVLNATCYLEISEQIFTNELFNKILERNNIIVHFYDISLTKEQLAQLEERQISVYVDNKLVSRQFPVSNGIIEDLKKRKRLNINLSDIPSYLINNFIYLNENCEISFLASSNIPEEEKYRLLQEFLLKIDKLKKPFKLIIDIKKRSLLEKSGLLNNNYENLEIIINDNGVKYTLDEFVKEEEKLNNLIKDIKNSNLSPFEKFIAAYNIVKKYKQYRESENPNEARDLKYILDNEYIVCVGFANLLNVLLDKLGIDSMVFDVFVDFSYVDGYTQEPIPVTLEGHTRLLVNIDDDKYNIHGIYSSDPTWDNDLEEDFLNYALMPIDKSQTNSHLFWINDIYLIFDVHNFQEFNDQVNYLFKKDLNIRTAYYKQANIKKSNIDIILESYNHIVEVIKKVLVSIDLENWNRIYSKYSFKTENDYIAFLTEIGHYIVKRTNNTINGQKIIRAHLIGKKELLGLKRKQLLALRNQVTEDFYDLQMFSFPYYLTDKTYLGEKATTQKNN